MNPPPKYSPPQFLGVILPDGHRHGGTVVESIHKDGRWIYKMTFIDEDSEEPGEMYDNWIPEEWLVEITKRD